MFLHVNGSYLCNYNKNCFHVLISKQSLATLSFLTLILVKKGGIFSALLQFWLKFKSDDVFYERKRMKVPLLLYGRLVGATLPSTERH